MRGHSPRNCAPPGALGSADHRAVVEAVGEAADGALGMNVRGTRTVVACPFAHVPDGLERRALGGDGASVVEGAAVGVASGTNGRDQADGAFVLFAGLHMEQQSSPKLRAGG
eukprot:5647495-Pleurochrysis_carterae.AAC.1